jgi:hypothetical protein
VYRDIPKQVEDYEGAMWVHKGNEINPNNADAYLAKRLQVHFDYPRCVADFTKTMGA